MLGRSCMQEISLDYIAEQYKEYSAHMKWYLKGSKKPTDYKPKILSFIEFVELNFKGKYHII